MMLENGRVVAVDGHRVWVETRQNSACGACVAKAGCGQGVLNGLFSGKRHFIQVDSRHLAAPIQVHDEVELAIDEHVMLKGSFWVYVLPLLLMIGGAVLAQSWWPSAGDASAISGAVAGFVGGLALLRLHALVQRNNPAYRPVLHRVVRHADGGPLLASC